MIEDFINKEYLDGVIGAGNAPSNLVLNVEMVDDGLIRFDILSKSLESLTYSSRMYSVKKRHGFNGIFDILDDFFEKRIKFFNSSISVQRFLIMLHDLERMFMEHTGNSFMDFWKHVSNYAVSSMNMLDAFSNPMMDKVFMGYGIEKESAKSYALKENAISILNCISGIEWEFLRMIREDPTVDYFADKFGETGSYVCVNTTDDDEWNFFMEPLINMPMLFHYSRFAEIYIDNLMIPYAKSGIFKMDKTNLKVSICRIDDDALLSDLLGMCDEHGRIEHSSEKMDGVLTNINEIEYNDEYMEGKMLSSIMAH